MRAEYIRSVAIVASISPHSRYILPDTKAKRGSHFAFASAREKVQKIGIGVCRDVNQTAQPVRSMPKRLLLKRHVSLTAPSFWIRSIACGVGATAISGCILPVPRRVATRPSLAVRVTEASAHAPIQGATIQIIRYNLGPPPSRISHRYRFTTDADGKVVLSAVYVQEWTQPLMMHGVPQWCFSVCIEADGYAPMSTNWPDLRSGSCGVDPARDLPPLEATLTRGEGQCLWFTANGMPLDVPVIVPTSPSGSR